MEEESEGSDLPEAGHVSDEGPDSDADLDSDAWGDTSEGSGWFADPDVEGQERYYDGSEWTSETRSVDLGAPDQHLPDHAGELQRALAAATDDIDDVEDRLGTLFDRAEQRGQRGGRARQQTAERRVDDAGDGASGDEAEAGDADDEVWDEDEDWLSGSEAEAALDAGRDGGDDDDDALTELDEALASEEPEQLKKGGLFRRRS